MRLSRVRFTIGWMMIALAIATVAETIMTRWAVSAARDSDGYHEWGQAALNWVLLHIPIAFVAGLMWMGYRPVHNPDPTESE